MLSRRAPAPRLLARRLLSTTTPTVSGLRPTIAQLLAAHADAAPAAVDAHGWVRSVRAQKRVAFVALADGSCAGGLQAVCDPALAKQLRTGASVRLSGKLVPSLGKGQAKELQVESVTVLGDVDPETYPIQKQALTTEYLRDHCHLRARTDAVQAMLRTRDCATTALHDYFKSNGFIHTHMPILTSSDCEGAGEAFRLAPLAPPTPAGAAGSTEFFGGPSFLTVSSQLHLEALAGALARVYAVTPCFRAERSQTARHLAEFWMLEAELAFVGDVGDVCGVVEGVVRYAARACAAADPSRAEALAAATDPDRPWARMTYTDAVAELERHAAATPGAFAFAPAWGRSLQSEHERWLAESLVGGPVFVTDYPAALKPFYMRANGDGDAAVDAHATVACFDLLVPGVGELAGGSLREERLPLLEVAIEKHGLDRAEYAWYTDLRRYGSAPHGGFGLGVERLVGWLAGVESVRECIPFPRWVGRMLL